MHPAQRGIFVEDLMYSHLVDDLNRPRIIQPGLMTTVALRAMTKAKQAEDLLDTLQALQRLVNVERLELSHLRRCWTVAWLEDHGPRLTAHLADLFKAMPRLRRLDITASLPKRGGSFSSVVVGQHLNLDYLNLSRNTLTAPDLEQLGRLTGLQHLEAYGCQVDPALQPVFARVLGTALTRLEVLDLGVASNLVSGHPR